MRKRDEPVRLTRIYTRTGDAGETSIGDGSRVNKTDPRVEAMGDVDELNSALGTALTLDDDETLVRVQNELFDLGADLSVPFSEDDGRLRVTQEQIDRLEQACDEANARLEPLKSFVLPGGTELAARLFLARAICRRAERRTLVPEDVNPRVPVYLNRLSDLLFILARVANVPRGGDVLWQPGGGRVEKPERTKRR